MLLSALCKQCLLVLGLHATGPTNIVEMYVRARTLQECLPTLLGSYTECAKP